MLGLRGLRSLFGGSEKQRAKADKDLKDEIAFHLGAETTRRVERGQSEDEARAGALRQFGNVPLVEEVTRDMRAWSSPERLQQDFRFALRTLRRDASFSMVALVTLALGIGATVSMFAIVNAVLLRPLPFPEPDRLVMVWERTPQGSPKNVVSALNFVGWRERNQAFDHIGAIGWIPINVTGLGAAEQVDGVRVTAEFFQALGVPPLLGRTIRTGEDVAGGFKSVVLSYGFWQGRFGGAPDVLGRVLTLNGSPHEIIGVMPASLSFPGVKAELFIPLPLNLSSPSLGRNLMTVARMKQGVTFDAARIEMERVAAGLAADRPDVNKGYSASVMPLMQHAVDGSQRLLWVLFGSVACLLLLACANVANLLLMRATIRTQEMAVRLALGAGRWRLVHQLIVESLVLTLAAGAVGLAMAWMIVPRIPLLFPATFPLPRGNEIALDGSVVLFTLLVSVGVGLVFGIIPGIYRGASDLTDPIRGSARAVVGKNAHVRRGLVIVEIALALVLVLGAGLMAQSLMQLNRVSPGFDTEQVLSLRMLLIPSKYAQSREKIVFLRHVIDRVRSVPGVVHASSVHFLPLSGVGSSSRYFRRDRPEPPQDAAEGSGGHVSIVTDGYFQTMGIPLLEGRDFNELDRPDAPRAVIVSETLSRQWFRDGSPLGKYLSLPWSTPTPQAYEIVGVVGDVRISTIDAPPGPAIYLAQTQEPSAVATLVVRTAGPPAAVTPSLRAAIAQVDPDQGVSQVQSLATVVASTTARPQVQALVLGTFGFLALLIATIGLYGVMSYAVEQRRREIGVRLALGAAPARLLRRVVSEAMTLAAAGIGIGVVLALGAMPAISELLYETSATDARALGVVATILFGVAALAAAVPARRATRVDPAIVLRDQ